MSFAWAPNLKLYYSVEKGDSKNLFEGWEITGLFTSFGELDDFTGTYPGGHNVLGGLKFKDVNGDGKIDNNDKMKGNMELPSNAAIIEVFISPEVYRKQETDSTILERIQNKFFSIDATMSTLTQRQGGSVNPENDALASFWADAYGTIMNLNQRLANEQNDDKKARLMKNRACIYSMLPVVFGDVPLAVLAADTLPARSSMADVYRLVEQDSYMAINALTLHDKTDALITIATVQMQMVSEGTQYYQQAATTCKQILDLGTLGWQAGGDNEKYVKVSLLYAEAANENGQLQEALEAVNRLYQAAGLTIPLPPSSTQEQIRSAVRTAYDNSKFAVKGTKYTNTSRWGLNSGWGKYILLPIPQKAINNSRGIITQNAGW